MRPATIHRSACALAVACAAALAPTAGGSPSKSMPIQHGVVRGQPYVEFEYDFGAWNVGFLGRKGQRRVVLVGTGLTLHKSPEGVGVGTKERVFWRRVRGEGFIRRRCDRPDPSGSLNDVFHWVRRGRGSETVYVPGGPVSYREVTGVEVRAAPTAGCAF